MLENMPADTTEMRSESARVRRRKLRLRTIAELDGRTTAARRAGALVATFEAALGGELTGAQRLAVHNAAALTAIAEDAQARRLAGDANISLEDIVRLGRLAELAIRRVDRLAAKHSGAEETAATTNAAKQGAAPPPKKIIVRLRIGGEDGPRGPSGPTFTVPIRHLEALKGRSL